MDSRHFFVLALALAALTAIADEQVDRATDLGCDHCAAQNKPLKRPKLGTSGNRIASVQPGTPFAQTKVPDTSTYFVATEPDRSVTVRLLESDKKIGLKEITPWVLSILAILASFGNFYYTYRKDVRARRQSISDEFWIRKVVSPVAIEPLMDVISDSLQSFPADCVAYTNTSASIQPPDYQTFSTNFQKSIQVLCSKFRALLLVDPELCRKTLANLEKLEDVVLTYCSMNQVGKRNADGSAAHPRNNAIMEVRQGMLDILQSIKDFQVGQQ